MEQITMFHLCLFESKVLSIKPGRRREKLNIDVFLKVSSYLSYGGGISAERISTIQVKVSEPRFYLAKNLKSLVQHLAQIFLTSVLIEKAVRRHKRDLLTTFLDFMA